MLDIWEKDKWDVGCLEQVTQVVQSFLAFERLDYPDTEYLGQKFTGYEILTPPPTPPSPPPTTCSVCFHVDIFSISQVWVFVNDKLINLHFQGKNWC